jgi:hypothetical protein
MKAASRIECTEIIEAREKRSTTYVYSFRNGQDSWILCHQCSRASLGDRTRGSRSCPRHIGDDILEAHIEVAQRCIASVSEKSNSTWTDMFRKVEIRGKYIRPPQRSAVCAEITVGNANSVSVNQAVLLGTEHLE